MHPVFGMNNAFEPLPPRLRSTSFVILNVVVEPEIRDAKVCLSRFYAFLEDLLSPIQNSELSDAFVFVTELWEISKKQFCVSSETETHFLFVIAFNYAYRLFGRGRG